MKNLWLKKNVYNYIYNRVPRLCVDLIVKSKEGVLMTLRNIEPEKNKWHLPGGRVFYKESLSKAIKRIAKDEVGLNVKVERCLGIMEFLKEKQFGKIRHTVSLVYSLMAVSKKVRGGWQANKIKYFKVMPNNTNKIHRKFLMVNNLLK